LSSRGHEIVMTIRDNGRGCDLTQRRDGHGLGLAGMETRARGCGGTFQLETAAGKGLKIEVTCPNGQ
jgi:signal transduction histidine kinase